MNSREKKKILVMFASLARHYFRFKKYEENKRKDRCKDKILFDFDSGATSLQNRSTRCVFRFW